MKKVKIKQGKAELPKEAELSQTKVVDMHELVVECQGEYEKAVNARSTFVDNQLKWFKKRYGIRPKKTFPWPGAPFSKDTEILTRRGWININNVMLGEDVYTRDDNTKQGKWERVEAVIETYQPLMYHFYNQGIDLMVSPEHTMIYENAQNKVFRRKAKETSGLTGYRIPLTSKWTGTHLTVDDFQIYDWMEFLGWYISEGWMFKSGTIGIGQSEKAHPDKCKELERLFTRMNLSFCQNKDKTQYLVSCKNIPAELRDELKSLGTAKYKHIPQKYLEADTELLHCLLKGLIGGDGSIVKRCHHTEEHLTYYTCSKILAGNIQELVQKVGFCATITSRIRTVGGTINGRTITSNNPQYSISIRTDQSVKYTAMKRELVEYNDFAYCVTVPSHAIYVRRDGKPCWSGNSNMHIPLTDKTIRKMKPDYVWTLWNTVPMCSMQATGPEDMELADRAEWHLDWVLRTRMKIFPEICLAADKMLGKGFCIAKVIYKRDYEPITKILLRKELTEYSNMLDLTDPNNLESFITILSQKFNFDAQDEKDRKKLQDITQAIYNNAEAVEFTVDDPCYDAPLLSIYNPEDIVVPADTISVFDLEKASFIDHVYLQTPNDFLKDKLMGKWDGHEEVADNILRLHGIDVDDLKDKKEVSATRKEKPIEEMEKRRTGNASKDDMIEIHERCMWFDSDNDGLAERHILNYCEEDMTDCLRFIKYPLGKKWPYVKIPFEFSGDNHDNPRGIPELLSTINASMNIQHNSKINRQTLSTALMFWYVPGEVNSDNIKFIPGQGIPVKAPGNQNFGIVQVPDVGYSFEKEEQILKAYAEEYIGTTDFGMASAVNPTGTGKARTATELEQIKMSAAGTRRLDILIWKMAWAEIFDRIFTQWVTMGPAEVWSAIDGTGKPAELTPSELDYHFNIVPAGDITTSDPEVELEKARQRAQMFAGNKYIRQYNLTKEMLSKDDPRVMKSLLVTQQEAQMIDQAEAQAQQTMQKMEMIKLLQGGKGANAKGSGAGRKAPAAAKT